MRVDPGETPPALSPRRDPRPQRPFAETLAGKTSSEGARLRRAPVAPADPPKPADLPQALSPAERLAVAPGLEGRDRAFGFAELGLLSAFGTSSADIASAEASPASSEREAMTSDVADRAVAPRLDLGSEITDGSRTTGGSAASAEASLIVQLAADPAPSATAGGIPTPTPPIQDGEADAPSLPLGAARSRSGQGAPALTPQLVAALGPGGLSVVAGARLAPAEAARLAERLAAVAREHGLDLADLQINGLAQSSDGGAPKGARNGHRAR